MKLREKLFQSPIGKILNVFLCVLTLQMGVPLSTVLASMSLLFCTSGCNHADSAKTDKKKPKILIRVNHKDTAADFNFFLGQCSLEERIQLMQSLKGLDIEIKDEWFGNLAGLDRLDKFSTDKDTASAEHPLKPETFNQVAPVTVIDAINKGYIGIDSVSKQKICEELVWRRYNKIEYPVHDPNMINYHTDIVQWVAGKKGIDEGEIKIFSTYHLERRISEKYFEEIWDKLSPEQRMELLNKIEKENNCSLDNKTAIVCMGGAAAIGTLSATVAFAGFAFYTTMSVVICTVAGWFGVTLPFVAYTTAASGVSSMAGPVGWIIAVCLLATTAVALGWPEVDTVTSFVMVMNAIKAKHLAD